MNAIYGFLTKDESFLKGQLVRRVALRRALQGEEAFDPNNVEHLLEALPEFARAPAMQMRKQIDDLSARVLNSDYGTQNISEQIREQILGNLGKYMRRKYRVFDDPEAYFKSAQYKKTVKRSSGTFSRTRLPHEMCTTKLFLGTENLERRLQKERRSLLVPSTR